jgi:hypothetical protein
MKRVDGIGSLGHARNGVKWGAFEVESQMAEWTDEELRSAVRAYLDMLSAQDGGVSYSKAQIRRQLRNGPLQARSVPSIEYRMRNITAVLEAHGRSTVKGYLAAKNVGDGVSTKIWQMVRETESAPPLPTAGRTHARQHLPLDARRRPRPPVIYFNIGWMKNYAGPVPDDETIGGHRYLGAHRHGAESYNFAPTEHGTVRGYRPPGNREQTNITRMGAARTEAEIKGALVVWLAKEPGTKRTLIVGWYRNATVFRTAREGSFHVNGERIEYTAEARVEDATLLPPVARTFEVRSSRLLPGSGFGQKPTWYGAEAVDARVWAYTETYTKSREKPPNSKTSSGSKMPPKNPDPELRRKVEKAAVKHAMAYYEAEFGSSCIIESVETAAKGWDLEVYNSPEPLLVEVKGLLNEELVCELTPNEYEMMMRPSNRRRYVIYIVNNALAEPPAMPIASIFKHAGGDQWCTSDGRKLVIKEKIAAVLTCR